MRAYDLSELTVPIIEKQVPIRALPRQVLRQFGVVAVPCYRRPGCGKMGPMNRNAGTRAGRGAVLAVAAVLVLAACGEESADARAKATATALSDYYYQVWRPPSPDWEVLRVRVGKDKEKTVTVDASIMTKGLTKAIMERSRMEQMEIARMACPAADDEVWKRVAAEQPVGIALSGSAGHIINALCKHHGTGGDGRY
ncbi:MAG: hypothetical protein ACE5GT_02935 [Rhodospirillales bacterium]